MEEGSSRHNQDAILKLHHLPRRSPEKDKRTQEEITDFISHFDNFRSALVGHENYYDALYELYLYHQESFFHTIRTADLYHDLAEFNNYSSGEVAVMTRAGLAHDLGKLDIAYDVLNKPGPLDLVENSYMAAHLFGSVGRVEALEDEDVWEIIAGHHKPVGMVADDEEMQKKQQLLIVADVVDACLSPRVYRNALTPQIVTGELTKLFGADKLVHDKSIERTIYNRLAMSKGFTLRTLPLNPHTSIDKEGAA